MTTAQPPHARTGRLSGAWRGFRRWRRARPFWGGLLTALAGLEIFGTTQMSLGGLSFQMGPTGFLSWLIPTILVACGLLLWFSPQQRLFYAVVAAVTALFSLIGVNLGGFFVGLLLGMIGSALGFAWTPDPRPAPIAPTDQVPAPAEVTSPGYNAPGTGSAADEATRPSPGGLRFLAVLFVLLGLAATVAVTVPDPVRAAPARSAPACPTRPPAPDGTPSPAPSPATQSPSPGPAGGADGGLIGGILDGIGDLLGVGGRSEKPTATPSGTPGAAPTPTDRPAPPATCPTRKPKPEPTTSTPPPAEEDTPLPRIAADPGQPVVGAVPSKLTGSKVTMTGLRFAGIVDLPTADGTLRVLKFSMRQAVTDDFLLRSPGPSGRTMRFATDRLTVRGDVAFYATRFVGRLLGIKVTLTPDLPLPGGIPITVPFPITFTDPVIDLAFVTSDTLTAKPRLKLTLD
ncbi:DUF6114 domain-containing protein [Micromonospora endolithica]|uniref:Uncharacterized protein n=1 Tax=Micromonospora endolithica TaxID=230091 RepID=A0A3A9YQE1_9ACTN|nr:DUF6114 domain-containing protein [Micromonospora endolithica]RKN37714.1 hypothetical protein D7223_32125 [Micromonospora endolithica]TWJ25329.1 hypothetical protein JD76_05496 [Micromonospora endolithica]